MRPPRSPGVRLRPHFGLLPSFCRINFCYIFARIVPALYLAICVFSFLYVSARKRGCRVRCLHVAQVKRTTWVVVFAEYNKTSTKGRLSDGLRRKKLPQDKRRWSGL